MEKVFFRRVQVTTAFPLQNPALLVSKPSQSSPAATLYPDSIQLSSLDAGLKQLLQLKEPFRHGELNHTDSSVVGLPPLLCFDL